MVLAEQGQRRKLAAILSADVFGYSRLMQDDDAATVETLTKYRNVFSDFVTRHDGRVVDSPGDNILAEFASPVEAVQCAVEVQRELGRLNRQLADHRQMRFRIGINLGDVLSRDDGTLYGDGVNIAARLEALAEPGGIMISESAHLQVRTLIDVGISDAGEYEVKNIAEPVHAYRMLLDESVATAAPGSPSARYRRPAIAAISVLVLAIGCAAIWLTTRAPAPTEPAKDPILAMPTGPTIAVLPFNNMSGDPEQEYFSDGITEEIITELSRRSNLFVIARNSTFRYKGQSVDVRQVGEELGARYVLEGSVRQAAGTIRVTAQLLAAADGTHLWAETYERELSGENLFDVQDQITENVVGAIGGRYGAIQRADLQASRGKAPSTLEGYDCVLRAITTLRQLTPQLHLSTRECLERAVEQEPDYAEAWAYLSYLYQFEYSLGFNPQPNSLERGLKAAQQAVRLDSSSQLAHQMVAYNYFLTKQQSFFDKVSEAIAINPNNPDVIGALGLYLAYAGEWGSGIALLHKAVALNPDFPGWVYIPISAYDYIRRDYQEALRWAKKIEMPGFFWNYSSLAVSYGQLGMQAEAAQAVSDLLTVSPSYAQNARREFRKYYWDETELEHVMDGFRKAGLDIPDEPVADN
jgi:adenylate cyclase